MATDEPDAAESGESGGAKKGGFLIWIVVMVISIAGGAATPIVISGMGSANDKQEKPKSTELEPEKEFAFIEFDEVTVNLSEARHSRYLRLNFSLQVGKSQMAEVQKQLDARQLICKNWLQVHVSEKSTEDLDGKYGRNRLRREILDFFNEALFDDGIERIQDILFSDFHVQ